MGYVLRMSSEPWLPGHPASGYLGGSSVLSAAVLFLLPTPQMVSPVTSPEEGPAEYRRHETRPKSNLFLKITALCLYHCCFPVMQTETFVFFV